jgi:hypothetical protein
VMGQVPAVLSSALAGANAAAEAEECTRLPTVFFANRHHYLSYRKERTEHGKRHSSAWPCAVLGWGCRFSCGRQSCLRAAFPGRLLAGHLSQRCVAPNVTRIPMSAASTLVSALLVRPASVERRATHGFRRLPAFRYRSVGAARRSLPHDHVGRSRRFCRVFERRPGKAACRQDCLPHGRI